MKEKETDGYDLIAMATHGGIFIGDSLFSDVSESLKHQLTIPLLLLRYEG